MGYDHLLNLIFGQGCQRNFLSKLWMSAIKIPHYLDKDISLHICICPEILFEEVAVNKASRIFLLKGNSWIAEDKIRCMGGNAFEWS